MTYQQSLEMIEKLKNIVWPYTDEWFVFFDFKNETEFVVTFFENTTENLEIIDSYRVEKLKNQLPYSYIAATKRQSEADMFYYYDINIDYYFNIMTETAIIHNSGERLRQCPINMGLEMIRLTRKLEDMSKKKAG